jgi:hypothetical protein
MPNPCFEFFEVVAEELSREESRVLTRNALELDEEQSTLLEDLKSYTNAATREDAIRKSVEFLEAHFLSKGSQLPFTYDANTGRFTATDKEYLEFVHQISNIRSSGKKGKQFELSVLNRLKTRAVGSLHRVGHPRQTKKTKEQFNRYLKKLGFNGKVLIGQEKDGGFDILWLLPIGTIPHRPIVCVQCKNAAFDIGEADKSCGPCSRSLYQHSGLQHQVHVPCVLFNDYICPELLPQKQLQFVPLGLSDLIQVTTPLTSDAI